MYDSCLFLTVCLPIYGGAELLPTSMLVSSSEDSGSAVDAECSCGCQLVQPVGHIISPANHSCFKQHHQDTDINPAPQPVVWHIHADHGRVVQLTYRLLAARRYTNDDGHDTFDVPRLVVWCMCAISTIF